MNDTIEPVSQRQKLILDIISLHWPVSKNQIQKLLLGYGKVSSLTILRDLNHLIDKKMIKSTGKARSTSYSPFNINTLSRYFDMVKYFDIDPDKRYDAKKHFDFTVFEKLNNIFNENELLTIKINSKNFKTETRKLNKNILKKEMERFTIELAWKSSKIEGNTYTLLETEKLLKDFEEAKDKTKAEKQMILNHKMAFQMILSDSNYFKELSVTKINQLHNILIRNLEIEPGIRRGAVGITGTVYKPLDNQFQIQEAMEKMVQIINANKNKFERAFIASIMIAYIQPYNDGNKRASRMLTNALLLTTNLFPLSYRSVDEDEYKKAIVLFYEQNSIYHLKRIFIDQFVFANRTYFS